MLARPLSLAAISLCALASACAIDEAAGDEGGQRWPEAPEVSGKLDVPVDPAQGPTQALLTSREYKLRLDPLLFSGDPQDAVDQLFEDVDDAADEAIGRDLDGELELDKERLVRFLDVAESCDLRAAGFVLRERIDTGDGDRSITLKYRSPDRDVAASVDTSAQEGKDKFEEDIVPPYLSKFSRSTKVETQAPMGHTDDLLTVFAGLAHIELVEAPVETVSGLTVTERVYGKAQIDLGKLDAEVSATLWYLEPDDSAPMLAEISFSYSDEEGDFPTKTVGRGIDYFAALVELEPWRLLGGTTKTAAVYGAQAGFCESEF